MEAKELTAVSHPCPDCLKKSSDGYPFRYRMHRHEDRKKSKKKMEEWRRRRKAEPTLPVEKFRVPEVLHLVKKDVPACYITACGMQFDVLGI